MRMHDRGALFLRDTKSLEPAGKNRERRDGNGGCAEADIGPHPFGITKGVQGLDRRVMKEMEVDAAIDLRPGPFWMPRCDQMHLVAARGDALRDRFHEAADGIALESRIGRCDHDNALAHAAEMRTYHNLNAASERSSSR